MNLITAFNIKKGDVVVLVGAGGKTSTMYALGKEAVKSRLKVVLTTTTRIYHPGIEEGFAVCCEKNPRLLLESVEEKLKANPLVVAGAEIRGDNKLTGVNKKLVGLFLQIGADLVIVEGDGAAGRSFKAPLENEPVIPDAATIIIPVVGIDCLGRPLTGKYVHRPEKVTVLTGLKSGELINPQTVSDVLLHKNGYRKDLPDKSVWIPLINKVETPEDMQHAQQIAKLLKKGGAKKIVIGSTQAKDPARRP